MRKLILLLLCASLWAQTSPNYARMLSGVNTQTGTTYTFLKQDATRITEFSNTGAVAVALPSGLNQGFGAGTQFTARYSGTTTVTITCTSCTINGAATLVLQPNQYVDLYSSGQNYTALVSPTVNLQTNGVANTTQNRLNLVQGSNVTLSSDGVGNVTIASSGGGGGGGSPGGSNQQLQFNNSATFGGVSGTVADSTTGDVQIDSQTRIRYANLDTNWSQLPSGTLTAGVQATVTLTPCPIGIDGRDTIGKIYVSGVGTAEPVTLQGGGTCTSGAGSGTIKFTPANNHSAGYTLGSASSGIYEAMTSSKNFGGTNANHTLILGPAGDATGNLTYAYLVHGTVTIPNNNQHIDGHGAFVQCDTRDYCFAAGPSATQFGPVFIDGLRIASTLNVNGWAITNTACSSNLTTITAPGHGIIVGDDVDVQFTDNKHYWGGSISTKTRVTSVTVDTFSYTDTNCGGSTTIASAATPGYANIANAAFKLDYLGNKLSNIFMDSPSGVVGHFNNGIVIGEDEAADIDHLQANSPTGNSHLGTNQCTSAFPYCGSVIYAPGPFTTNASVVNISDSSLTIGCHGNGITAWYGNTLGVQDTVVQGMSQWGIYTGNLRGGFGPTVTSNIYEEVGSCTNPWYAGSMEGAAGVITVGRPLTLTGGECCQGGVDNFGTGGATTFYYYIVVHDSVLGVSAPFRAGQGSNASSQVVQWPRVPGTNTITYDIIRTISNTDAPSTGLCTGGSVNACGSVALARAQCAGLICSFTDNTTLATTSYTVTDPPTLIPFLPFWPGNIVSETNGTDGLASALTGDCLGRVEFGGNTNFQGLISTAGNLVPCLYSSHQNVAGTGNYGSWISSPESSTTNNTSAAYLLNDINATPNLKGRFNITRKNGSLLPIGEFFTFVDCDPSSTRNNNIKRPTWDSCDTWVGNDVSNAALNANNFAFGTPTNYNFYVGVTPSSNNWTAHLDGSLFRVKSSTVQLDGSLVVNIPCTGCGPASLSGTQVTDNFNRADSGSLGANWTVTDGTWTILSNQAKNTSVGGSRSPAVYTGASFSNDQYAQVTIVSNIGAFIGPGVRFSNSVVTGYYFVENPGTLNSGLLIKIVAGVATALRSSCTSTGPGDVLKISAVGTTITPYTNGVVACTPVTDSAIASGFPGMMGSTNPNGIMDDFRAGDASWSTGDTQTYNNIIVNGSCTGCGSGISGATNALPAVATSATTATSYPAYCIASQNASGDICTDINACYSGAIGPGVTSTSAGIIDARGYPARSNQVCNSNPFTGGNRGGMLLLGNYNIYTSKTWITPQKKMRIVGVGQSSPLSSGNLLSEENTQIRPCTGANTPVTGCAASILQTSNKLFQDPTYSATATNASGTTAVFTTSTNHNYTFTSGTVDSHILVTGCSVTNYNNGSGGNPSAYFKITAATANTITVTLGTSGNGAATGCTIKAPPRQHGRYSASGSGLTNPNNYYAMFAIGGQQTATGYDGNGTCGTGPIGANWTLSAFGSTLEHLSLSADGLAGLILAYSGNIQERGGFKDITFNNYGGLTAGQAEGNGIMFDRNAWNLNDACANSSGNGGPSHFIADHIFCDAAPVSNPGGPGASDVAGVCAHLAGNHSESDGTSVEDGGGVGGLAQYGFTGGGTIRGLNDSGKGKSNYGIWAENYDDGVLEGYHFENLFHDPFYLHGTSGWTSKGWQLRDLDFASSSGTNNAVMHLDTGTDANMAINLRGAAGANPAAVRDEVNGCGSAFGAAAPCIVNGNTDGNPMSLFVQGYMNVYNGVFWGKQAAGSNPSTTSGTGAPTGACVSGSEYLRTDGTGPNEYDCVNSAWVSRVRVASSGSLTSTAVVTGAGTTNLQTPSATSTLDASGNLTLAGSLTTTGGGGVGGAIDEVEGTSTAGASGHDVCYADSTAHSILCSYNNRPAQPVLLGGTIQLTSQYTNSTTGFTNVSGGNNLAIAVAANANYSGTCTLYYQAAATGGLNIEFTGPASPTNIVYSIEDIGSATTLVDASVATAYSTSLGAAVTTATTNFPATVTFALQNGANAGTLQLLAKSSASVQLQIQKGSFCTWTAQ